jgi:hypothetical protein
MESKILPTNINDVNFKYLPDQIKSISDDITMYTNFILTEQEEIKKLKESIPTDTVADTATANTRNDGFGLNVALCNIIASKVFSDITIDEKEKMIANWVLDLNNCKKRLVALLIG